MVTGEFAIQVKYKSATRIEFEDSCKFIITGNFGITLNGGSDKRRIRVIGFTSHYNESNTPTDEFGHRMFEDWVGDRAVEYQYFYNFMFACIQAYLNKGISDYKYDSVIKKGISNNYPSNLINAIEAVKHRTIGVENAMRMKDWYSLIGVDNNKSVEAFRKTMELDGYVIAEVSKRVNGLPSKLYYWHKK